MRSWIKKMGMILTAALFAGSMQNYDVAAEAKCVIEGFDLEAHRGGRALRPENTLDAFANALEIGVTTLEMDTYVSKDGVVFVSHNPRTFHFLTKLNGTWLPKEQEKDVRMLTMAELKKYDIGGIQPNNEYRKGFETQVTFQDSRYPTLQEVFDLVKAYGNDKVTFNIETKSFPDPKEAEYKNNIAPDYFVNKLHEVIAANGMKDRVVIQSFDWRTLVEMKRLDKDITLAALISKNPKLMALQEDGPSAWLGGLDAHAFDGDFVRMAHAIAADIISPNQAQVTADVVAQAHSLGMKVLPWTVNKREDMIRMIDLGVDGIISDNPALLREVCVEKGIAVAAPNTRPAGSPYNSAERIVK